MLWVGVVVLTLQPLSIQFGSHQGSIGVRGANRACHRARRPCAILSWNDVPSLASRALIAEVAPASPLWARLFRGTSHSVAFDEYTRMHVLRYNSTRFVGIDHRVPVLSLTNIQVDASQRRQGHARRAIGSLRVAAADNQHALVVENVVSQHMHKLVRSMDGRHMPGSRPGANGCHYWIPSTPHEQWEDLAVRR